jgi:multidrug efflux pump subunit AcrA (membrane-fusion protein)
MFVDVNVDGASARSVVLVPKSSIQAVGSESVVYVAREAGRFTQRTVTVGDTSGDHVAVIEGLEPGDSVVSEGAFFLRAEAARMTPETPAADTAGGVRLPAARP